jgi:IS5 family transposase
MAPPEEPDEDGPDEDDADYEELKAAVKEAAGEAGFVTEDRLTEKLDEATEGLVDADSLREKLDEAVPDGEVATKAEVESMVEEVEQKQERMKKDAVDAVSEKAQTGGTPSPSGGPANDQQDYGNEIKSKWGTGDS